MRGMPGVIYMLIVRQFAEARGLRFFTWKEQRAAMEAYEAIAKLKHGLKHEEKWNSEHRQSVTQLVKFLESGSNDINDLSKYSPE